MTARRRIAWTWLLMLPLTPGCAGDDANPGTATTQGSGGPTTGGDSGPGPVGTETSTGADAPTSTGGPLATSTGTGMVDETGDASTGAMNRCDPVVPGEWNACITETGTVDNTLCNWTGLPGADGFVNCLTAPENAGNTCVLNGCQDACDCFAPPSTGTAPVVCADILAGGGFACVLACANGETCPDGMECLGGTCFHPSAM